MSNLAKKQARDLFETFKKQAKQVTPGKLASAAASQVAGSDLPGKKEGQKEEDVQAVDDLDLDGMFGSVHLSSDELSKLKSLDASKRKEGISETRVRLKQEKIKRYQRMQQEILREVHRKEEEIPAYEAGKPGAPRTWEEKKKLMEEKKKKAGEEDEKQAKVLLPRSTSKQPKIGFFAKQRKGTGELKLGKKG